MPAFLQCENAFIQHGLRREQDADFSGMKIETTLHIGGVRRANGRVGPENRRERRAPAVFSREGRLRGPLGVRNPRIAAAAVRDPCRVALSIRKADVSGRRPRLAVGFYAREVPRAGKLTHAAALEVWRRFLFTVALRL